MTVASPSSLPGNILTLADSDFETGSSTWAAFTNANTPTVSSANPFTGTHSLAWSATANGSSTVVATGFYPCTPLKGYDVSGVIWTNNPHDAYIGIAWYNVFNTLLSVSYGSDYPTPSGGWQTLSAAVTSPISAAKCKIVVQAATSVTASEAFNADLLFAAMTSVQVLIDWVNPAFSASSVAGADFIDVTPWVRFEDNLFISRGRQNGVSEIQAGSAQFNLQNDMGWFTQSNSGSPVVALGGTVDIGARAQVNITDEAGIWHTRFDGPVAEIDYTIDPVGNTNIAAVTLADVLAYLSRQPAMNCWAKSAVVTSVPWLHWSLNDATNAGETGVAAETSGNNGPVLTPLSNTSSGTIQWSDSTGGVETLADTVHASNPDMSDCWTVPGIRLNPNIGNGTESGWAGPYTTPLSSILLTPSVTPGGLMNVFVDNVGYALSARLDSQIGKIVTSTGSNYAFEAWFAVNPSVPPYYNQNVGPFTVFDISSSRNGISFMFGLFPETSHMNAQLATYAFQPTLNNFSVYPVIQQSTAALMSYDIWQPLPHHVVVNVIGANSGPTLQLWYDGAYTGSVTLPAGTLLDTVSVGGAYGGWGAFWGNIQLVSIYKRTLSISEIQQHCQLGQYGMWETPTDVSASQVAKFAGIPQFWNALTDDYNGLTLTDYYSISGSTALANMQAYEQAEGGLLYVSADGKIKFATRDWRMGYGAPDLALPPDTYSSTLGYQIIDQYIVNQTTVSTSIYQRNLLWIQANSTNKYGAYSVSGQYPLITWNRAGGYFGLPQYLYSPNPALTDNAAWQASVNANSRLTFGTLTFDLLTLDPNDGIAISQLYALDINNMVTLSSTPSTMANATGVNELFIEGMQETISLSQRSLSFYTSPATAQRAWIPGDSTYGLIGSTARIGISEPDYGPTPAIGKRVAHDAGAPYWPPAFTTPIISDVRHIGFTNFSGTNVTLSNNMGLGHTYQGDCIIVQVLCPAASTIAVSDNVGGNSYSLIASKAITGGIQYVFASLNSLPLNGASVITVTGSVNQSYVVGVNAVPNVTAVDVVNTNNGASTGPNVSVSGMTTLYDIEMALFFNFSSKFITGMPSGWAYVDHYFSGTAYTVSMWKQSAGSSSDSVTAAYGTSTTWGAIILAFKVSGTSLNNPSGNGHQFIGGLETRGLHDNLATILEPPLMMVGQTFQQTMPTGNDATPQLLWTFIGLDSTNGMGAVPTWSNWYVCTVPGFYELSGQVAYQSWSSGATGVRNAYFAIAAHGAMKVGANAATPVTNGNYVCITGEQHAANGYSIQPVSSPSTRIYLGLGDMVALCTVHNQGANDLTGVTGFFSGMQARWCGYSTTNDQVMLNDTIGAAGTVTELPTDTVQLASSASTTVRTFTQTWASTGSRSYYGANATLGANTLRSSGGTVYQGQTSVLTGTQFSFVIFPYSTIQAALSGSTVLAVTLSFTTTGGYYSSGLAVQLGWSSQTSWGSTYTFGSTDNPNCETLRVKPNASLAVTLNNWANAFKSSATSLIIGDDLTASPICNGQFGATWSLTITYKK